MYYSGDADEIGFVQRMRLPLEVGAASRGHFVKIDHTLRSDFYFGDLRMSDEFMVVPDLREEATLNIVIVSQFQMEGGLEYRSEFFDISIEIL